MFFVRHTQHDDNDNDEGICEWNPSELGFGLLFLILVIGGEVAVHFAGQFTVFQFERKMRGDESWGEVEEAVRREEEEELSLRGSVAW